MFRRALYLIYYLQNLNFKQFLKFLKYTSKGNPLSMLRLILDCIWTVFRYNNSIMEYFQFGFHQLNGLDRSKWAGTGYMFEFQLKMNPKNKRDILDDKTKFYKKYKKFFLHEVADLKDLKNKPELVLKLINNPSGKLVFKVADGKCGVAVEIKNAAEFNITTLIKYMVDNKFDLVEEFIIQHPKLNELSPSAVNTVRVITQLNQNNEVIVLGCRQRISVNSSVDNMAAGNLAAPIDEHTGVIFDSAVYSDITKTELVKHPVSGVIIVGFEVPFWKETIEMAKAAAQLHPQNRSIGWDIVITENGPGLIEGNHDWCKLLWQLPVKKGLKYKLNDL